MLLPSETEHHENVSFRYRAKSHPAKIPWKSFVWSVQFCWRLPQPIKFDLDYRFAIFYNRISFHSLLFSALLPALLRFCWQACNMIFVAFSKYGVERCSNFRCPIVFFRTNMSSYSMSYIGCCVQLVLKRLVVCVVPNQACPPSPAKATLPPPIAKPFNNSFFITMRRETLNTLSIELNSYGLTCIDFDG